MTIDQSLRNYFALQARMTNRWFKDAGIHPLIGYVLAFAAFIGISAYLFYKTIYAVYVYPFLALTIVAKLSEIRRNDFLSQCFPKRKLNTVRIIENLLVALPFAFFLCYRENFLFAILLLLLSLLLAFANFRTTFGLVIPTPFYKKPFEFIIGFRNSFYLLLATYLLASIAVFVRNFNLGIFSLILAFFVCLFFYIKVENEYFVWSYSLNAREFLLRKINIALRHASVVVLPIVLLIACRFYYEMVPLLLILGLGYVFLVYMIVAKYAAYPKEMSLMQTILMAVSIMMPLFLMVLIPYYFLRSVKYLNKLLNDKAATSI